MMIEKRHAEKSPPVFCYAEECFNLAVARLISGEHSPHVERYSDGNISFLDLSGFSTYTQEALDFLVQHPPAGNISSVVIGFRTLTLDGARALSRLKAEFVELPALIQLDANVAAAMRFIGTITPVLMIGVQQPLNVEAAEMLLFARQEDDIHLSLPSLSREVATALRRHPRHSMITIRDDPLSVMVAEILAHHEGYSLWIDLGKEPVPMVLQALSSNPAMPMVEIGDKDRPGHLYCISLPEFVPKTYPATCSTAATETGLPATP